MNRTKYLGFIGSGKPINYKLKRYIDEKCYNFQRPNEGSFQIISTNKSAYNHRHKHGLNHQRKARNKYHAQKQQNIADQQTPSSSQQSVISHFSFVNSTNRLMRFWTSSVVFQSPSLNSNEVHTTTQNPSKPTITKKHIKPSKRYGKTNSKVFLYENSDRNNSTRHRHPYDYRISKQNIDRSKSVESRL